MKKISSLFAFCAMLCASASMAQDIAVTGTDPAGMEAIKANAEFSIQVQTEFVEAASSPQVTLYYAFGEDELTEGFSGTVNGNVPAELALNLWQTVTATGTVGDVVDFTAVVTIVGDGDATNDTIKTQFVLAEAAGRDLEITIVEPEDGIKVKTWTDLPMVVKIKNTGAETLPTSTPIIYQLGVNGQAADPDFFTYGGDPLTTGDSIELPLTLAIARNAQTGPSEFCFNATWGLQQGQQITANEHVNDNNSDCFNVEVEPNSINESVLKINSFFYANQAINMSFSNVDVKDGLHCEVIDLSGRVLVTEQLPEISRGTVTNHSIRMPQAQNGAYILKIYDGELPVATQKFIAY